LELVRDGAQRVVANATAYCEEHGEASESNQTAAKARIYIATCNRAIRRAKARIDEVGRKGAKAW